MQYPYIQATAESCLTVVSDKIDTNQICREHVACSRVFLTISSSDDDHNLAEMRFMTEWGRMLTQ